MLIIVPPSESKRAPSEDGAPVDLETLSFPVLTPLRRRIVDSVMATSAQPDAFARLHARLSMAPEVIRNTWLSEVPAMPAFDVYTGPLHEGLDVGGLSGAASELADRRLVVVSPVWGALRTRDRIPPYRVHVCARLTGIGRLEPAWRTALPAVLAEAAGGAGVIVDLRSPMVQAMGMPQGLGGRTVILRVDQGPAGRRIGGVVAKRVRGEAAHHLLESGATPADAHALADVLGSRWPVRLDRPESPDGPWILTLSVEG